MNLLVDWGSSDPSIVRMGDGTGEIAINQGEMLEPGVVTITATWPADELSPAIRARITVEVLP